MTTNIDKLAGDLFVKWDEFLLNGGSEQELARRVRIDLEKLPKHEAKVIAEWIDNGSRARRLAYDYYGIDNGALGDVAVAWCGDDVVPHPSLSETETDTTAETFYLCSIDCEYIIFEG